MDRFQIHKGPVFLAVKQHIVHIYHPRYKKPFNSPKILNLQGRISYYLINLIDSFLISVRIQPGNGVYRKAGNKIRVLPGNLQEFIKIDGTAFICITATEKFIHQKVQLEIVKIQIVLYKTLFDEDPQFGPINISAGINIVNVKSKPDFIFFIPVDDDFDGRHELKRIDIAVVVRIKKVEKPVGYSIIPDIQPLFELIAVYKFVCPGNLIERISQIDKEGTS